MSYSSSAQRVGAPPSASSATTYPVIGELKAAALVGALACRKRVTMNSRAAPWRSRAIFVPGYRQVAEGVDWDLAVALLGGGSAEDNLRTLAGNDLELLTDTVIVERNADGELLE